MTTGWFGRRGFAGILGALLLVSTMAGKARAEGDPEAGEKVFRKCAACHATESGKHKIGPSLSGVVGRVPGTADGFKYSDAMQAFGGTGNTWDQATLDAYLANPRGVVKGTRMAFPGLKAASDRADIIAYLKSLPQ